MPIKEINARCEGCAFTPGTEANSEPHNFIKAMLCVLSPSPFYCHDTMDWKDERSGSRTRQEFAAKQYKLCTGWMEEVRNLAATGYFRSDRMITKLRGAILHQLLIDFMDEDDPEEKAEIGRRLQNGLTNLVDRKRKFEGEMNAATV